MRVGFVLNLNFMLLLLLQPPSRFMLSHCSFNHNLLTQFHSHLCCKKPPAFICHLSYCFCFQSGHNIHNTGIFLCYLLDFIFKQVLSGTCLLESSLFSLKPSWKQSMLLRGKQWQACKFPGLPSYLADQPHPIVHLFLPTDRKNGVEGNCGSHSVQPLHNKLLDELAQSHVQSQGWKFLRLEISYFSASLGNTAIFQYLV